MEENKIIRHFFNAIQFEKDDLTIDSKNLINQQVSKNQLKGFFNWEIREGVSFILKNKKKTIILFEYIISNFENKLNKTTQHEVYNLLLNAKILNGEYKKGLQLIGYIENNYNKDSINFAFTLGRKGEIYTNISRYSDSLVCYYQALEILDNHKESSFRDKLIFSMNNGLAIVYTLQKEYKSAIDLFNKNLKKQQEISHKGTISMCYTNLGFLHKQTKKYTLAIDYYLKAQKLRASLGDIKRAERLNTTLTKLYILNDNLAEAEKQIDLCKSIEQDFVKKELIHLKLMFYVKKHESTKITDYKTLNKLTSESLNTLEKIEDVNEKIEGYLLIAKAYELVEKYKEAINILHKKNELEVKSIEEGTVETYQRIRTSHEIQLQQKEIEKKESLLQQKEESNKRLLLINSELEQFTAMASHDLKSPLRTILAICGLMQTEDLSKEEMNEYLDLIQKDAIKMNNLVSSLLKYSKIGYSNLEMTELSLNELIEGVLQNVQNDILEKNALVKLGELPKITGNKLLLVQLFENLLNNALKYNDKKQIEISIQMSQDRETIEFSDNGIGISPGRISEIFKAFTRAHSAIKYEGSGVGLATCKKVMDIHGGNISVRSQEGIGTCFILNFNHKTTKNA